MSSDLFAGLSLNPSLSPKKSTGGGTTSESVSSGPASPPAPVHGSPTAARAAPFAQSSPTAHERLTSAPATDKLLGLLGMPPSSPAPVPSPSPSHTQLPPPPAPAPISPAKPEAAAEEDEAAAAAMQRVNTIEAAEEVLTAFSMDSHGTTPGSSNIKTISSTSSPSKGRATRTHTSPSRKSRSSSSGGEDSLATTPGRPKPTLRGVGTVTTPIPNAEVTMRMLRKFAQKTQANIPSSHGGTLKPGILGYLFVSTKVYDSKFDAYKALMEVVLETENAEDAVAHFCHLLGVWGHASGHMAEVETKTSSSYQTFCDILSIALDTATALVSHGCLDGVLIATRESEERIPPRGAVSVLAESVFSIDLSQERVELAAMKFLLSTGCRVYPSADGQQIAMLRGSHLLQTIRVLYHVYLTTVCNANKTTARASLQQLVTLVFIRMIASSSPSPNEDEDNDDEQTNKKIENKDDEFPTENHRDAFLVLRSLCKLSMRNPPSNLHSHIGLQAGNSNTTWDAAQSNNNKNLPQSSSSHQRSTIGPVGGESSKAETPHLVYTQAIHPALESKILALDLLLYVLQNTDMKGDFFLQHSGIQFHHAIRNYLCVSLLKNCTSDNTRVVSLSLRVFVPIIRNFRAILKTEIEAFVTNVFFVILDSKNSPMEHKLLVVTLFEEICSDPQTLAEIFLNYDCDLSAVDLFHRIVNTLARVARSMAVDDPNGSSSTIALVSGAGAARMEKTRSAHRQLRLEAMRALRQVLASLHGSIVKPMDTSTESKEEASLKSAALQSGEAGKETTTNGVANIDTDAEKKQNLVEIYGSKKKRREEESEVTLRFNQKPSAGLAYAAKCGHVDGSDPEDVARYLLANMDKFDKTQIGELLGREPDYQNGFAVKVLHGYVNAMDFEGLAFDDAIRYYLSGFRLPGEAQKIDRIMEKFAERYTAQNPDVFPSADVAFILAFSIIMLNTDLHNPAIKEERRMTKDGFIRNNRGVCDGQDLPPEFLMEIFDRIKSNPISLKEDDEARERATGDGAVSTSLPSAISPAAFFASPYEEADRTKETNFNKERDQIVRTTESLLRRRRRTSSESSISPRKQRSNSHSSSRPPHVKYVRTEDSGLRDEYVSPMFEVTWGAALAAFSTAMESANGTVGALLAIATDEELEAAAMNAAETIEVCLTGFRFAICTAGLCGNEVARDAYMLALSRFSQLGTGALLEPRHVRCIQTILTLARADGELLGSSWEHVFKALSEINRFHQLFQLLARNDKAIAVAAERRRARLQERERQLQARKEKRLAKEKSEILDDSSRGSLGASDGDFSYDDSDLFSDSSDYDYRDDMNKKEIDEANARSVYEAVSEGLIEAIYERSSSLSTVAVKEFVLQLCRVSRMEISHYGGQVGSDANQVDLTQVQYRQHHSLLGDAEGFQRHQPNIYNLQKLVEVTHYNMESRPRLVFADIWTLVSAHLTSTALHANPAVAMYAVDSFRQLSIQYLQREELGVFEFQRRFLKPLETVMARSEMQSTKELLLKCVERLILMFGGEEKSSRGMLRSGWRPVLTVLGIAGRDRDESIAKLGFGMLTAQLEPIFKQENRPSSSEGKALPGVLLDERFIDLVDALLVYVEGPHEEMSLKSIDHLLTLSAFLADDSFALPLISKRGAKSSSFDDIDGEIKEGSGNEELELWWPVLLGISKAIGDDRKNVRMKSLEALSKIITSHFFPTSEGAKDEQNKDRQIQRLQLIFRGVLTPVLEFAEGEAGDAKPPPLPEDFERFLTGSKGVEGTTAKSLPRSLPCWLDTTFEQFMDMCVSICVRSGDAFGDETLVEEIFAMLNNCLLSDSGALAVRGLRRLEQLLTSDLKTSRINDDTWATVSHMLRRCLTIRSLPRVSPSATSNGNAAAASNQAEENCEDSSNPELEKKEAIREFVMEDTMLADRRFIGSNAVMVIGSFLSGERFAKSLGLRWRVFLVSGLGKAIRDWEYAAVIIAENRPKSKSRAVNPPSYLETAIYGRKYMNRFLLQLASRNEIAQIAAEGSRQATAQNLIKEQTQGLVTAFLEREASLANEGKPSLADVKAFERLKGLVKDMLAGYDKIPEEHLVLMSWLNPVLTSCINTGDESIRIAIQKLVTRLHE